MEWEWDAPFHTLYTSKRIVSEYSIFYDEIPALVVSLGHPEYNKIYFQKEPTKYQHKLMEVIIYTERYIVQHIGVTTVTIIKISMC